MIPIVPATCNGTLFTELFPPTHHCATKITLARDYCRAKDIVLR